MPLREALRHRSILRYVRVLFPIRPRQCRACSIPWSPTVDGQIAELGISDGSETATARDNSAAPKAIPSRVVIPAGPAANRCCHSGHGEPGLHRPNDRQGSPPQCWPPARSAHHLPVSGSASSPPTLESEPEPPLLCHLLATALASPAHLQGSCAIAPAALLESHALCPPASRGAREVGDATPLASQMDTRPNHQPAART